MPLPDIIASLPALVPAPPGAAILEDGATRRAELRDARALFESGEVLVAHAGFVADVTERDTLRKVVEDAVARSGPVELLISNAGQALSAPFARTDAALFQRMLDVNLFGVVHSIHAVLPSMIQAGFGRIVVIASIAGLKGYPYVSAYCAAKHAAIGVARSLAAECATTGVTVNAVCPGYTDTDLVTESIERIAARTGRSHDEVLKELVSGNPQKRLIDPPEIADAVLLHFVEVPPQRRWWRRAAIGLAGAAAIVVALWRGPAPPEPPPESPPAAAPRFVALPYVIQPAENEPTRVVRTQVLAAELIAVGLPLNGDPSADLGAVRQVHAVLKDGVVVVDRATVLDPPLPGSAERG